MKKSSFIATILGVISCMFFGLGMCMATLPEWNAFIPGIVVGCIGLVIALIAVIIWRKMEHKEPIKITGKTILTVMLGVIGTLALGIGMCFVMLWEQMILGIGIGIAGILLFICLIPVCKGFKEFDRPIRSENP